MKLLVVIHSLDAGGTQKFLANLTAGLVERDVTVDIVTLSLAGEPDFFPLPPGVARVRLALDRPHRGAIWSKLSRDIDSLRQLRKVVRSADPDVVLSLGWSTNVIALASTRLLRVPVVISERVDPRDNPAGRWWPIAQRLLYPFADHLVTQTEGVERFMRSWVRPGRVTTIPNPIPSPLFAVELQPSQKPHIVAVCRLSPQKGVDVLLRALELVRRREPEAQLSLVGGGPNRSELELLAEDLGIASAVRFHGMIEDPTTVSRTAWCGCLASRNEGFPNALLEMMALGLPVVSTDCRSGPAELLGADGGILVPVDDHVALADALSELLADAGLRRRLGAAARLRASHFADGPILDAWYKMLREHGRGRH